MIPAAFDYEVAESVEHASELLARHADAKLLAGGHSLIPLMRLRFARPSMLVDIGRLDDLSYVHEEGDHLLVGALTRYHDLERSHVLQQHCPLLAYTAGLVGDPQVRHRGTIGGSVAHGDPASDIPTVLVALDAELVVRGTDGRRVVPAADFFRGFFEVELGPHDVLTEIRVPKLAGGWSYQKFTRRAQDWAIVGACAAVRDGNAAVALTNMGPTPVRARAVEAAYSGDAAGAAEAAAEGTTPPSDANGSAEYRRYLAQVLVRRALEEAAGR
jgi:carbon-monoxide dehydrogenase medium subunit